MNRVFSMSVSNDKTNAEQMGISMILAAIKKPHLKLGGAA
ncbi:hypothetical protein THF1C08_1010005 [Vibrio jasicida]|uniref:Transposase n=1 Tax=Vibrio jasicida TaxID=766224 RepID=A0AAU9QIC9_9VIBR|nr:hypothetical protein THF1C08_1010005 [Vibrio jasicida]CAH1570092.1 hypothetical protein THF1A12_1050005 [Vibrio jasicida]